jgi:hypothetical protein
MGSRVASGGGAWSKHATTISQTPKSLNMLSEFPTISLTRFQPLEWPFCKF